MVTPIVLTGCSPNTMNKDNNQKLSIVQSSSNPAQIKNTTQENKAAQEELPICPTETATGCRHVPGKYNQPECTGSGPVSLISPMNLEYIGIIIPMGLMVGGHVTPIDHMYFQPTVFHSAPDTYNVYADADGVIESIGVEPAFKENKYTKIRLVIYHTCDFYSIYNLLTSLSPEILKVSGPLGPGDYFSQPIVVKKGDILGKIGGQTLDLSVNYNAITLPGFLMPEHYQGEEFKLHTVDPFDYFEDTVKHDLLAKNVRQVEPRSGKIDYDIDGRLVGNWFIENTGGYSGNKNPEGYWSTHAAFAYNHIDPEYVMISLGSYEGEAKQFGILSNAPDPKDVSVATGLVKYELTELDYVLSNGQQWDHMSFADDVKAVSESGIEGVVVVQLISERKLKLEVFPRKRSNEVTGFGENAIIYER